MGKKHRKHHRHEKKPQERFDDELDESGPLSVPVSVESTQDAESTASDGMTPTRSERPGPLKLVLKVGGTDTSSDTDRKHKHKKKKKKKYRDDEKYTFNEERSGRKREHEDDDSQDADRDHNISTDKKLNSGLSIDCKHHSKVHSGIKSSHEQLATTMRLPEPVNYAPKSKEVQSAMHECLMYLQKVLQRKDVHGIFAYPVNDVIAPGYSSIIDEPMDFSKMLDKIDEGQYYTIGQYKRDFQVMCKNAMKYNQQETIFYREAKRLCDSGVKLMSKEKLRRTLSAVSVLSADDLGLDDAYPRNPHVEISSTLQPYVYLNDDIPALYPSKKKEHTLRPSPFEPIADDMTPEEILAQARTAARGAADLLTMRKPNSQFGFLKRREDGSTTFNILNPENSGIVNKTERVVSLGELVGKITSGTGCIQGFKEDKRNRVTPDVRAPNTKEFALPRISWSSDLAAFLPNLLTNSGNINEYQGVTYLNYGPFSSFAPTYDSSFANLSKEESDLVLNTYGDDTGVQYANSVMNFVDGTCDYTVKMVDNLLDRLTKGEHSKTQRRLEKRKENAAKNAAAAAAAATATASANATLTTNTTATATTAAAAATTTTTPSTDTNVKQEKTEPVKQAEQNKQSTVGNGDADFQALRALREFGIDVSFLEQQQELMTESQSDTQTQLTNASNLIKQLEDAQKSRLSQPPPMHLAHLPRPSEQEVKIATKVQDQLKTLAKRAGPGNVVTTAGLRKAMGITLDPVHQEMPPVYEELSNSSPPPTEISQPMNIDMSKSAQPIEMVESNPLDISDIADDSIPLGKALEMEGLTMADSQAVQDISPPSAYSMNVDSVQMPVNNFTAVNNGVRAVNSSMDTVNMNMDINNMNQVSNEIPTYTAANMEAVRTNMIDNIPFTNGISTAGGLVPNMDDGEMDNIDQDLEAFLECQSAAAAVQALD